MPLFFYILPTTRDFSIQSINADIQHYGWNWIYSVINWYTTFVELLNQIYWCPLVPCARNRSRLSTIFPRLGMPHSQDTYHGDNPHDGQGSPMPIAVIGIGFRGPGEASSVEGLWNMMKNKQEAWSPVPKDRWNHEAFYHPDSNRSGTVSTSVIESHLT